MADVETLDHLYIRVISPIIAAFVVIMTIMFGLGLIDARLANTLGGIMLTLLVVLPFVFYYAGKPIGRDPHRPKRAISHRTHQYVTRAS